MIEGVYQVHLVVLDQGMEYWDLEIFLCVDMNSLIMKSWGGVLVDLGKWERIVYWFLWEMHI